MKYMDKDSQKIFGKWYFSSRDLVKKPDIQVIRWGVNYDEFRQDNPDAPEISLYKDVRLTSVDVLKEGDCH